MAENNGVINAKRGEAVPPPAASLAPINPNLFGDLLVSIEARLGQAVLTVKDVAALKAGSVVTLQTRLPDHVDLYLNDVCIARGEIVAVGQNFGVRIVEIAATP